MKRLGSAFVALALAAFCLAQDDQEYTSLIRFYTTDPRFSTPLVDHLPASSKVPSPLKYFGHIIGEPGVLHNTTEINGYMRALAVASPRVRVESMGKLRSGREMILVLVSDEANLRKINEFKKFNDLLSDPRKLFDYKGYGQLQDSDSRAEALIKKTIPFYYFTAGVHPWEAASHQASMEFMYRLAVDESPFIRTIRRDSIVLFTPVMDPDGLDRFVRTGMVRPKEGYPDDYVGHDINRDNLGLSLPMSDRLCQKWFEYHPVVLNDLHQSMPHLFISPGTGPYNPWLDKSTTEDALGMANDAVGQMTGWGVPGVYTKALYDGYSPTFSHDLANCHNAIGRVFEVDGAIGADTGVVNGSSLYNFEVTLPNPPLKFALWSFRDAINLDLSAMLLGAHMVASNREDFTRRYYQRGKASMQRPWSEGPAAYVIPRAADKVLLQRRFLALMAKQRIEVKQLVSDVDTHDGRFKTGSYIIRLDQPYGRFADMLFERQHFPANVDRAPYDQVGWSLDLLFNLQAIPCTDLSILRAPVSEIRPFEPSKSQPVSGWIAVGPSPDPFLSLPAWRDVKGIFVAEKEFEANGQRFEPGSFLIPGSLAGNEKLALLLAPNRPGPRAVIAAMPSVPSHALSCPRIAIVQDGNQPDQIGWLRLALRELGIAYTYLSIDQLTAADLKSKYDVILLPYVDREAIASETPSDDQKKVEQEANRLNALKMFLSKGGLAVFFTEACHSAAIGNLTPGLDFVDLSDDGRTDSILLTKRASELSPVLYGYSDRLPVMGTWDASFSVAEPSSTAGKSQAQSGQVLLQYPTAKELVLSGGWFDMRSPSGKQMQAFADFAYQTIPGTGALVQYPVGSGNVLLFGFNPTFRQESLGDWQLLCNAFANWSHLRPGNRS